MMKKLMCAVLALVLALACACATAEGDLQAQLDAANAKIAELEALVEKYEPFYTAQLAATFGEDGVVWVDDVMALYEQTDAQYTDRIALTVVVPQEQANVFESRVVETFNATVVPQLVGTSNRPVKV